MPWIPLHQTWQIYPLPIEYRCLEYHYTKLGRSTPDLLADQPPQSSIDALNTITPNLAVLLAGLIFGRSPPQSSIDALHTTTLNLADLPPPSSIAHGNTGTLDHFDILYWEICWYCFTIFSISQMHTASLSHPFKMHISYHCHFLLLSISNWLSAGVYKVYSIPSLGVKVHLQCCAAQPISVEFHKICTTELQ